MALVKPVNAGWDAEKARVPKGRLRSNPTPILQPSVRDFCVMRDVSRRSNAGLFSRCPSGTKEPGGRLFRQEGNPIDRLCLQGHFAATVPRQEDLGHKSCQRCPAEKCGTRSAAQPRRGENCTATTGHRATSYA